MVFSHPVPQASSTFVCLLTGAGVAGGAVGGVGCIRGVESITTSISCAAASAAEIPFSFPFFEVF